MDKIAKIKFNLLQLNVKEEHVQEMDNAKKIIVHLYNNFFNIK